MYTTNVYTCLNIRHIVFYRYSFLLSWPVVLIFLTLLTLLFHLLCWSWHTHLLSRDIHQCCASFTWYFALHWPYIPSYSCNCVKFKFAIFFLPPRSGSSELSITLIPDHLMPSSGLCGNLILVVHLHKYILMKYRKHFSLFFSISFYICCLEANLFYIYASCQVDVLK